MDSDGAERQKVVRTIVDATEGMEGTSGFRGAPVSLGLAWSVAGGYLVSGAYRAGTGLRLPPSFSSTEAKQVWRLATGNLVFVTPREFLFGAYLIYYCRTFERRMGSKKFGSFLLVTSVVSSLLQVGMTQLCPSCYPLATGPFGFIFACAVPFVMDVPVTSKFKFFGLPLTNKSFVMAAGTQLLLTSWKGTLIPGACGLLAGTMYRVNFLGMKSFRLPSFVNKLFQKTLGRILVGSAVQHQQTYQGAHAPDNSHNVASTSRLHEEETDHFEVSEEGVELLVSMGFDRGLATQALYQSGNDVNLATNRLLEGTTQ